MQWPQTRPTLTGGVVGGRLGGTPAQVARPPDDPAILTVDDGRARRKNTPGDQSMRRTIQDLVASVDPNVKMEPEVEDVRLSLLAFSTGVTFSESCFCLSLTSSLIRSQIFPAG